MIDFKLLSSKYGGLALAAVLTTETIFSRSALVNEGCTGRDRHSRATCSVTGRSNESPKDGKRCIGVG